MPPLRGDPVGAAAPFSVLRRWGGPPSYDFRVIPLRHLRRIRGTGPRS